MSIGRTMRDALAVSAIALVCAAALVSPLFDKARGLSIDLLTLARWELLGPRHDPATSPVVVIALDEETYDTAPFAGSPTATWTGEIGRVLGAVLAGGASVVGFDIVFERSIEQSDIPFGDGTFGDHIRGFDRDFLRALAAAASAGKVVLGEELRGNQPILPASGQRIAVRQQQNIRPLNVYTDSDEVIRRLPLTFVVGGNTTPGMALELASRSIGKPPEAHQDGTISLDGYPIPGALPNTMTLNFDGGSDDIPTYSFADLRQCANSGEEDYFRREFEGKVVLIGTVRDDEDRRVTSKRFATRTEAARRPRCALPEKSIGGRFEHGSIAGVYIHATAIDNLIRKDAAREFQRAQIFVIAALFATLSASLARTLKPSGAAAAFVAAGAAYLGAATFAFSHALVLPLIEPIGAGLAALVATTGYRYGITDRERRLLQRSFAYYLAPHVIDTMLASNKPPQLGGETREVTILFSDIAGFSEIAEQLAPDALMRLTNAYLSAMTDVIESFGGYVDKYIGDSVVAIFGAPVDDLQHAASAARAALGCNARLAELNRDAKAFVGHTIAQRIGINSGPALVGNFGSQRRFNYSVMSDAVNLASRLEGANRFYGTTIIASETTVKLAGDEFAWRELDTVRVKGRTQALKIHELVAFASELVPAQRTAMADYAAGLSHWRAQQFELAAAHFERAAAHDPPSALFCNRARAAANDASMTGWEPVRSLSEK